MQKFTVKQDGAKLAGPVELRLFHTAILEANKDVLGARWPRGGQFTLAPGASIGLRAGDVVQISNPEALTDGPEALAPDAGDDVPVRSSRARKG